MSLYDVCFYFESGLANQGFIVVVSMIILFKLWMALQFTNMKLSSKIWTDCVIFHPQNLN